MDYGEHNGKNDSNVSFAPADANHPANWTITNGTTPTGVGAKTTITSDPSNDHVTSVTTTIGTNTTLADGSPIFSATAPGFSTIFAKVTRHEIGHTFGLGDVTGTNQVAADSAMNQIHGTNDVQNFMPTTVTSCDNSTVNSAVECNPPPPLGGGGSCTGAGGTDYTIGDRSGGCSPIIIDTEGEGFHLTSASAGVRFDISGNGHPLQMGWTDSHFHNAFLALPGPDGLVHNGRELFGNFTPQPPTNDPNGFLALAQFDKLENGGNGDGIIDERDAVYSRLRLWIDENHDGISQPNELHPLAELGAYSLALNYTASRLIDSFGNQFRFRATVNPGGPRDFRDERQHGENKEVGRWTYDVFFVTAGK